MHAGHANRVTGHLRARWERVLSHPGHRPLVGGPREGRVTSAPAPRPACGGGAGVQPGRRGCLEIRRPAADVGAPSARRQWARLLSAPRGRNRGLADAVPGMLSGGANMAAALRAAGALLRHRRKWGCRGRRRSRGPWDGGDSRQLAPESPHRGAGGSGGGLRREQRDRARRGAEKGQEREPPQGGA